MLYANTISKEANQQPLAEELPVFFSPSSIVAIFNAATVTREEKKIIQVRGIFKKAGTASYGGYYYDKLKEEASDNSITLLTSAILHNQLEDNKTIEFNGFISRKVERDGKISIHINLVELLSQRVNKFSEEETRKIELLNKKVALGFKDLDALIKNAIFHNQRLAVKVIMGRSGIIDSDISKAMEEAVTLYDVEFHRISLASPAEIIKTIQSLDRQGADLICLARGGGENLEIFENLEICETILHTKTVIASAIGHAQDVSLFEKLADKKFITPTQFGNYLKEIYNNTLEEFEQSKAKLVHDISTQLAANYGQQIQHLAHQLKSNSELHEKTLAETRRAHAEQQLILNNKLKGFEELTARTALEKGNLHTLELTTLKQQLGALQEQQLQKDKLIQQSGRIAADYQNQLRRASARVSIGWIVAGVIVGLVMGWLLAHR